MEEEVIALEPVCIVCGEEFERRWDGGLFVEMVCRCERRKILRIEEFSWVESFDACGQSLLLNNLVRASVGQNEVVFDAVKEIGTLERGKMLERMRESGRKVYK